MAITSQDDLNSYTTDATLIGGSGGSGWTSNWGTGQNVIVRAPVSGNTNKVARASATNGYIERTFNSPSNNKLGLTFYALKTATTAMMHFGLVNSSHQYCWVFNTTDFAQYRANGTNFNQANPFTANNTFYKCRIEIDKNSTTNNVRFYHNDVLTYQQSQTITVWTGWKVFYSLSGYPVGSNITELSIDDIDGTSNNSSAFMAFF